jgi:hypothetical protein
MRSEAETNREANSNEPVRAEGEPEILLNDEVWKSIGPDNLMIRTLRAMTLNFSRTIELEAQQTEKTLKSAKKVYYGG